MWRGGWQVREVREFLEKYSLQNADDVDINAAHVPEAQIARLATMVETVNDIHSRALRMDGSNAAGLVSASVDRCAPPLLCCPSRTLPVADVSIAYMSSIFDQCSNTTLRQWRAGRDAGRAGGMMQTGGGRRRHASCTSPRSSSTRC